MGPTRCLSLFVRLPIFLMAAALAANPAWSHGESSLPAASYAWIQLGPDGVVSARAVTEDWQCPVITVDSAKHRMNVRASAPPPGFEDILGCEFQVPAGASSVVIAGQTMKLPAPAPQKILVIGDTGCRIKGSDAQNCNGKGVGPEWAFPEVADAVIAEAPDLVIHVGDYHYRESQCPATPPDVHAGCADSPFGYNWPTWKVDFFDPGQKLLAAAPWIFVRGNHEQCPDPSEAGRAWRGWFYFLDPRPLPLDPWDPDGCQQYTDPYRVPVGDSPGLDLLIMDTAEIPHDYDAVPDRGDVNRYADEFSQLEALVQSGRPAWMMTHRPIWAVATWGHPPDVNIGATDQTLQWALAMSAGQQLPAGLEALLAGHIHQFEYLALGDGRPPQVVVGGSGTKRDPPIDSSLLAANPSVLWSLGITDDQLHQAHEFSYLRLVPATKGWQAEALDIDGQTVVQFTIGGD